MLFPLCCCCCQCLAPVKIVKNSCIVHNIHIDMTFLSPFLPLSPIFTRTDTHTLPHIIYSCIGMKRLSHIHIGEAYVLYIRLFTYARIEEKYIIHANNSTALFSWILFGQSLTKRSPHIWWGTVMLEYIYLFILLLCVSHRFSVCVHKYLLWLLAICSSSQFAPRERAETIARKTQILWARHLLCMN